MEYTRPSVTPLGGDMETQGTWLWTETVVAGVAYAIIAVVLTAIDITP
ncbi:hypothetical protein [Paenibacillus sp. S150]|nr:hypothetical protein [Paenibacillus sp. S150]